MYTYNFSPIISEISEFRFFLENKFIIPIILGDNGYWFTVCQKNQNMHIIYALYAGGVGFRGPGYGAGVEG